MQDILVFKPESFKDNRGELWTLWNKDEFLPRLEFNHDKIATSKKNVLRGLHGDNKSWKLITCLHGEIQLVVVDNRPESEDYLRYRSFILNGVNKKMVLVPPMFCNGHLVLSDECVFYYKWAYEGDYPDVDEQISLNWKDPKIGIHWLTDNPILSERDKNSKFI